MRPRVLPLLLSALVLAGMTAETCLEWRCTAISGMPPEPRPAHAAMHDAGHGMHDAGHGAHAAMRAAEPATMHVAAARPHDCCEREGLSRPPCCPTLQLGPEQSRSAAGRASDVVQLAATRPAGLVVAAPALVRFETPRRFDPGAPPGTLVEQHTSLLL